MKVGVVVFPGSNCDRDCLDAAALYLEAQALPLWHADTDLHGVDAIFLPGGFSYGDYLRSGAIARFSPVMESVRAFAGRGGPVLGICNGFQILCESGLLPGALVRNASLRFQCESAGLSVENIRTPFTSAYRTGQQITLPIAHAEGNYYAPPDVLASLERNAQVVLRYEADINGAANRIAGICNERGNVVGMMPHPERNLWPGELWNGDGRGVFDSLRQSLAQIAVPTA